jgi:DNA-binding transcriptional MocR family regulator
VSCAYAARRRCGIVPHFVDRLIGDVRLDLEPGQFEAGIRRAADNGVGIYGLSGYFIGRALRAGLLLGYSPLNVEEIREGIKRLGGIF